MNENEEKSYLASSAREGESYQPVGNHGVFSQALASLRKEIVGGLLYTHSRANTNTGRLLEATSFLYALIEILSEKGLLTIEELDDRKATVAPRIDKRFIDKGMGVDLMEPDPDLEGGLMLVSRFGCSTSEYADNARPNNGRA